MKKCIECGQSYKVEDLRSKHGENSALEIMECCNKKCLSIRTTRAESIQHLPFKRLRGPIERIPVLDRKNGIIDVMKVVKYCFLPPSFSSETEIAIVTKESEGKLFGFFIHYQSKDNSSENTRFKERGLHLGYEFEATSSDFKEWSKGNLIEFIEVLITDVA